MTIFTQETTLTGTLGSWRRLIEPLEANRDELSHLEASRARLEGLWDEAVDLNKQQAALTASKQETSKRLQAVLADGQRLATALRQLIRQHYGIRSEKLTEFHLQPFRGRARKAKPAPQPAPEPPGTNPAGA